MPFLLVAGGLALAGVGARKLHLMAPVQLAMGLVYGTFILTAWRLAPKWGRILTGSVGFLVLLNPQRAWQQVTGFIDQLGIILGRVSSVFVRAQRES